MLLADHARQRQTAGVRRLGDAPGDVTGCSKPTRTDGMKKRDQGTLRRLLAAAGAAFLLASSPVGAQEVSEEQLQACQTAISGFVEDVQTADRRFRDDPDLYQSFTAPGYFDSREQVYRNILGGLILDRANELYDRDFATLSGYDDFVTALKTTAPDRLQPVNLWVLSDLHGALSESAYSEAEADYLVLSVYENIGSYECGGVAFGSG
jgi:hypothetical protein